MPNPAATRATLDALPHPDDPRSHSDNLEAVHFQPSADTVVMALVMLVVVRLSLHLKEFKGLRI